LKFILAKGDNSKSQNGKKDLLAWVTIRSPLPATCS